MINVRDFGAVCDGVADDTEAFRRAFAFAIEGV
jgi:polygalacturonase